MRLKATNLCFQLVKDASCLHQAPAFFSVQEQLAEVQKALSDRKDEVLKMASQLAMKSDCEKQLQVYAALPILL